MSYSSDFHHIPIVYSEWQLSHKYPNEATLKKITDIVQAHWKVEKHDITFFSYYISGTQSLVDVPLIVNDNLPCGFTWISNAGNSTRQFLVIDLDTGTNKSVGWFDEFTSFSVCMPNAQNVIIGTEGGYSGRCYYVLSAMKDMAAEGQPFKTIIVCTNHTDITQSFNKSKAAISMSEIERDVYPIAEPNYRVSYQYGTTDLLRMMGTAVCYTNDTVFESDDDMFVAPLDTAVLETPQSIVVNDVEYVGINFNPSWGINHRGSAMYNYYFKVEE